MPALFLAIESDPEKAQAQRYGGNEVREIASDHLSVCRGVAGDGINNFCGDRYFPGVACRLIQKAMTATAGITQETRKSAGPARAPVCCTSE